jgi:hypothetical protein
MSPVRDILSGRRQLDRIRARPFSGFAFILLLFRMADKTRRRVPAIISHVTGDTQEVAIGGSY